MNHSKNAIVKPQGKTPEMAQQEVDEAMKKVREATMAIATVIEPGQETGVCVSVCVFLCVCV